MTYIVRLHGHVADRVHGFGDIIIFQEHPLSALGALGDLICQSPSKNMLELGAFIGPDAGDIDKSPLIG